MQINKLTIAQREEVKALASQIYKALLITSIKVNNNVESEEGWSIADIENSLEGNKGLAYQSICNADYFYEIWREYESGKYDSDDN